MYYVYIHYRADNLIPFYIGKGSKSRVFKFSNSRNLHWRNIFLKHGCIPKIVETFENEKDAFIFETYLIKKFKSIGVPLCNMTTGGEGCSGYSPSKELRTATSERFKRNTFGSLQKGKQKPKLKGLLSGNKNPSFKGYVLATNINNTEDTILLDGKISSEKHGFDYRKVSACVNGKRKTHKGYTFTRIKENSYESINNNTQ